jgi:hypothetical protein
MREGLSEIIKKIDTRTGGHGRPSQPRTPGGSLASARFGVGVTLPTQAESWNAV